MTINHSLPQYPESLWLAASDLPAYESLAHDIEVDAAVVGGGIAGITTAYLLAKEGLRVALVEAGRVLHGTTGHTTAKITAQHDLFYDQLIQSSGVEKAGLYYRAAADAAAFIKQKIGEYDIDCAYEEQDAYIYTNSVDYKEKLERELAAYEKLGIPGSYADSIPLPIPHKAAIAMHRQAQFHPVRYLRSLLKRFIEAGGVVYENTTAVDVEQGAVHKVKTLGGPVIACKYVVSCTHFPFYEALGLYFARLHAERSYVLGIHSKAKYPGGMFLSAEEPKRSLRSAQTADGKELLLIGGQSHKTGQGQCTIQHYEELEHFADKYFEPEQIAYRWSAQDLITDDELPYIGPLTSGASRIYTATGFRKWGMTTGTAAAMLIRDLIMERDNAYADLFSPQRPVTMAAAGALVKENLDVAKHLIAGKLELVRKTPDEVGKDEGCAVNVNGKRAGAYRDEDGKLYLVDTTCTHMGCETEWNSGDRTWDCPCHGSRFSITGEVIEGPAEKPLKLLAD
ncbi:FAD-dependent oxidoreductase [Paenibacillus sp. NPDC058071]|uniref:FAD-dependent oxidoreductase n=1 Tax=Paenibacillus sp. NPDC058071 TaxID=3346326 RepID=UPI0036DF7643